MDSTSHIESFIKLKDLLNEEELLNIKETNGNELELENYLKNLLSKSLKDIERLPKLLNDEAEGIDNDLKALLQNEYKTIISSQYNYNSIYNESNNLKTCFNFLSSSVLPLDDKVKDYNNKIDDLKINRDKSLIVLNQYDRIQQLISKPSEMRNAVNDNNFNEALQISQSVRSIIKFESKLSTEILKELENVESYLILRLINVLSDDIRLPQLSKAINIIKRISDLNYDQISIIFIRSRLKLFDKQTKKILSENNDEVIVKNYLDFVRQYLNDVLTQFSTNFFSNSNSDDNNQFSIKVLNIFTQHILDNLIITMNERIKRINDTVALSSIASSVTYLSESFSQIGVDISMFLTPIIEDSVETLIVKCFNKSSERLCQKLEDIMKRKKSLSINLLSENYLNNLKNSKKLIKYPSISNKKTIDPPQDLLNNPPIAIWMNENIKTLNSLRLLAPISIKFNLLKVLDESIISILRLFTVLIVHYPPNNQNIDTLALESTIKGFINQAIPYIRHALMEGIYETPITSLSDDLNNVSNRLEDWLKKFEL